MVLVTDVPMLAPIIIGIAVRTSRTDGIYKNRYGDDLRLSIYHSQMFVKIIINNLWKLNLQSAATMDTMIDDEVDDDCTNTVTRTPIIKPTTGLLRTVDC